MLTIFLNFRLLEDINTFSLWSNVCRDDFGYGRVPASSAAVEGEFNKLKNNIYKNENLPIRIDEFLRIHLDYLHGKLKIVELLQKVKIYYHVMNWPRQKISATTLKKLTICK